MESKYEHPICFQLVQSKGIYLLIFFKKRGPVLTSHEGRSQGGFWEQSTSLWSVKTTSQANLSKHKYSAQEDVYHILPELKLRRVFPALHFVNTNQVEERIQVLLFKKDMFLRIFFKNLMLICI